MTIMPSIDGPPTVAVPANIDWVAASKTIVLEVAFLATTGAVVFGHTHDTNVIDLIWALGGALFGLRITDVLANVVNVRAFLNKPSSGVVPQALGTPLITTTATNGGSKP